MNDIDNAVAGPKVIPGWVCVSIGAGFIAGIIGLLALVRVLAGS